MSRAMVRDDGINYALNGSLYMMRGPLVSIVITSYNYARYLSATIHSALHQTYPNIEVLVVDDGSTDTSPEIIASFGDRIIGLAKENGGQASAMNVGFERSRGEIVVFVDSDDQLLPLAAETAAERLSAGDVAKVHWPLLVIDEAGQWTGEMVPKHLPAGDLRSDVLRLGPYGYVWPDTTGNAYSRRFLEQVFPIAEREYTNSPDLYLCGLAPLFGLIDKVRDPQGFRREHKANLSYRAAFDERLREGLARESHCFGALAEVCHRLGLPLDAPSWRDHAWWHQIAQSLKDIETVIPDDSSVILVDRDWWGLPGSLAGRRRLHFVEKNGEYYGVPHDDAHAVEQLDHARDSEADFIVFTWFTRWFLDRFPTFGQRLRSGCRCVLDNERLLVFDLRRRDTIDAYRPLRV